MRNDYADTYGNESFREINALKLKILTNILHGNIILMIKRVDKTTRFLNKKT